MFVYSQNIKLASVLSIIILFSVVSFVLADAPTIQTPTPVIYLADNLDEKDNLGWCIDTIGRGFAERLHAHSCKPRGGDVQFSYDKESLSIQSVPFENKCVTINNQHLEQLSDESNSNITESEFMLLDCNADNPSQRFIYNKETLSFHPENNLDLCIAVGESSHSAGPYMSRSLQLDVCTKTDNVLWQWVISETSDI